jgi:hypothetical protein
MPFIAAFPSPEEWGTAVGGGNYDFGSTATVEAIPAPAQIGESCFKFARWEEDSVEVSTDRIYSFEVTDARELYAIFEEESEDAGIYDGYSIGLYWGSVEGTYHGWHDGYNDAYQGAFNTAFDAKYKEMYDETYDEYHGYGYDDYPNTKCDDWPEVMTINATATGGGSATGSGDYEHGIQINLVAIAASEFEYFEGWFESGKRLSTSEEMDVISYREVQQRNLEAKFKVPVVITIEMTEGGGIKKGEEEDLITETTPIDYKYDSAVILEAIPDEGYLFSHWENTGGSKIYSINAKIEFKAKRNISNQKAHFVEMLCAYEVGFRSTFQTGFDDAYNSAYSDQYDIGKSDGETDGENAGENAGETLGVFRAIDWGTYRGCRAAKAEYDPAYRQGFAQGRALGSRDARAGVIYS